ncbi:VOC family protein [Bacillus sp. ISL-46]|uniref:VOC family protein n=1 Tax=Bacillus sp. ISL-46 TaxID=2819129 RepID=UPI001BE859D1|nr:VOC family protein [Bacillus sp. ISL-46]MBT2722139.1 VOC family protein [Bacillus sp. ISL-46]
MLLTGNLTGVQHLGIPTVDLNKTIEWYEAIADFKTIYKTVIDHHGKVSVAFMKLGNLVIEAYQPSGKDYEEIKFRSKGHIDHLAIDTADIEYSLEEFLLKGAQLDSSTINGPVLLENFFLKGVKYLNFVGPNGETVELSQNLASEDCINKTVLKGWSHLGIPVTDINKSKSFYKDLGFIEVMNAEVKREEGIIKAAFMDLNGFYIELYQLFGEDLEEIKTRADGHIDHIALDVLDVDKAFNELREANYTIEEPFPSFIDFGDFEVRFFHVKGPDNEKIEFNQKTFK